MRGRNVEMEGCVGAEKSGKEGGLENISMGESMGVREVPMGI